MTETSDLAVSPRDAALNMLDSELRDTIIRLDTDHGPSLLNVMAARYGQRNGPNAVQEYLDSVAMREGDIMPADAVYDKALGHFDRLVGRVLPSRLRESLSAGDPWLPAGTDIHSLSFNPDVFVTMALTGVVAREFSPDQEGAVVNDDMAGCAYFFRAQHSTTVGGFIRRLSDYQMARKVLPGTENGRDSVAVIFDPAIEDPDYAALVAAPSEDYAARPKSQANSAVALPVGLPAGGIAGFVLGENVAADPTKQAFLRTLFPEVPLLTASGALLQ